MKAQYIAHMSTDPPTTTGTAVQAELFGFLFLLLQNLSRRLDAGLERFGLTSRQWLLLAVLEKAFPGQAPTLSEAAAVYGSSRQNLTQLARQLADRGYLQIERDPDDARATRLRATTKLGVFAEPAVRAEQAQLLAEVFGALDPAEVRTLRTLVVRCLDHLSDGRWKEEES